LVSSLIQTVLKSRDLLLWPNPGTAEETHVNLRATPWSRLRCSNEDSDSIQQHTYLAGYTCSFVKKRNAALLGECTNTLSRVKCCVAPLCLVQHQARIRFWTTRSRVHTLPIIVGLGQTLPSELLWQVLADTRTDCLRDVLKPRTSVVIPKVGQHSHKRNCHNKRYEHQSNQHNHRGRGAKPTSSTAAKPQPSHNHDHNHDHTHRLIAIFVCKNIYQFAPNNERKCKLPWCGGALGMTPRVKI
jgi:hypothetical protein